MAPRRIEIEWYADFVRPFIPRQGGEKLSDSVFKYVYRITSNSLDWMGLVSHVTRKASDSVFRAIDYYMDFIRFSLHNTSNGTTVNLKSLHNLHNKIQLLKKRLRDFGIDSEENETRFWRIEGCFQDIFSTLEECGQQRQDGPIDAQTGMTSPGPCEPFFKSPAIFPSEAARMFMTELRHIYIALPTLAPHVALQAMGDVFSTTSIGQLNLSEAMMDTAMRSSYFILLKVYDHMSYALEVRVGIDDDYEGWISTLEDCFTTLYHPSSFQRNENSISDYERCIRDHQIFIQPLLMEIQDRYMYAIYSRPSSPRPLLEPAPGNPPSLLWQKLRAAESEDAFTEGKEDDECYICHQENVTQENFSLLDKCDHAFCAHCIADWFENNSTCPFCRSTISSWTTRDHFLASQKQAAGCPAI